MWKTVERELQKINLENLGYAHPLSSGIMDDSLEPITEMPEELRNIFRSSSRKYIIPIDAKLQATCEKFVQSEKKKYLEGPPKLVGNAVFGKFLDGPKYCRR